MIPLPSTRWLILLAWIYVVFIAGLLLWDHPTGVLMGFVAGAAAMHFVKEAE